MYQVSTCSFCSVSSLSKAESVSRVSPFRAEGRGGLFDVRPFTDGRRATGEFREETRGLLAAERAVTPFAMELGGETETEDEVRREDEFGGVARPGGEAVVAMMENFVKSSLAGRTTRKLLRYGICGLQGRISYCVQPMQR
jgi:hypothetical protein